MGKKWLVQKAILRVESLLKFNEQTMLNPDGEGISFNNSI